MCIRDRLNNQNQFSLNRENIRLAPYLAALSPGLGLASSPGLGSSIGSTLGSLAPFALLSKGFGAGGTTGANPGSFFSGLFSGLGKAIFGGGASNNGLAFAAQYD